MPTNPDLKGILRNECLIADWDEEDHCDHLNELDDWWEECRKQRKPYLVWWPNSGDDSEVLSIDFRTVSKESKPWMVALNQGLSIVFARPEWIATGVRYMPDPDPRHGKVLVSKWRTLSVVNLIVNAISGLSIGDADEPGPSPLEAARLNGKVND
jgi:hypothetical protein